MPLARALPTTDSPAVDAADVDASWQYSINLANIRGSLIRQEDSIIFSLIERAQFHHNPPAYTCDPNCGGIVVPGFDGTLLEYVMRETEVLHGKVRRYTSPTERPFFPDAIPQIILPPLGYPKVLHKAAEQININSVIWHMYFGELLPAIAAPGDDFNYGSAVTSDVLCLQALSKRIHYGVFVAEAKFLESPETFKPLIQQQDAEGILQLLTKPDVEAAVLKRVEAKATAFGQEIDIPEQPSLERAQRQVSQVKEESHLEASVTARDVKLEKRYKIEPQVVAQLYGRWIMPLTKQVQVDYLLRRLDVE
jgi:chorismate mutase